MYETKEEVVYTFLDQLKDEMLLRAYFQPMDLKRFDGVHGVQSGGAYFAKRVSELTKLPLLLAPTDRSIITDDIYDSGDTLRHYIKKPSFAGLIIVLFVNHEKVFEFSRCGKEVMWFHKKYEKWIRFANTEGYSEEETRQMIELLTPVDAAMQGDENLRKLSEKMTENWNS